MGTKNHRQGGKFGGKHTTFTDLAIILVDIARKRPEVKTISAGFIQQGGSSTGGDRGVKILDMRGGLLLKIRQSRSVQEVRIFTENPHATKLAIAIGARNNNARISFGQTDTLEHS
ncbi:MAG: DUF2103 domain-containing protein [Candidatus Yanofskybacteria bacterium]|nr:DUF2103 domain-containing protein [Candidatus Yanofskybacteria bacterium]